MRKQVNSLGIWTLLLAVDSRDTEQKGSSATSADGEQNTKRFLGEGMQQWIVWAGSLLLIKLLYFAVGAGLKMKQPICTSICPKPSPL